MPILATDLDAGNSNGYTFSANNTTYIVKAGVVLTSNFTGISDPSFGSCRIVNYGSIVAGTGIYASGDQLLITNGVNGEISATSCISVGEGSNTVVNNDGTLAGLFEGINVSSSGRTTIMNTGTISATYAIQGQNSGDFFVDNSGTVVGDFYSIDALSCDNISVNNSGSLTGDLWLTGTGFVNVRNSGTISGGLIFGGANDVYLGKGGTITGTIAGNAGDDKLTAGSEGETLSGGLGHDTLTGGKGEDVFIFDTAPDSAANADQIRKFAHANDTFQLDHTTFPVLPEGDLAAGAFKVIASASSTTGVDANDRILYDKTHGDLYFDQDGSGAVFGRIKLAHLHVNTAVDASDFFVL